MGQMAVVAFPLTLLLSIQAVVGRDMQSEELNLSRFKPAGDAAATTNNLKELGASLAELELTPEQANMINEEIRDAMKSGELHDMGKVPLSPQQEENVFHTVLVSTFMKMAEEGLIDPEVVKQKLLSKEKVLNPEVESALNQIIQRTKISKEKKADAVKE